MTAAVDDAAAAGAAADAGSPDDDLALLTGDDAGELLAAALGTDGGRLLSWQARAVDVRRGRGATVSYRTRVEVDGGERTVWLGASTRQLPDDSTSSTAVVVSDGARTVTVWPWPHDPWLPALPDACSSTAVAGLLASFDVPPSPVRLQVHVYRPSRRAVLRGRSATASVFLKVLRPERARGLHDRHRVLTAAGLPVPRSLGVDPRGLVALQALGGTPMRERLRSHGPAPRAEDLLGLLDALPREVLDLPHRPSWSDGAAHYGSVVAAALTSAGRPADAARATGLADQVCDGLRGAAGEPEPTHGDLYEAQLLLADDGSVNGLLDLDSVGPGRRADDLACLLAHLEVLAAMEPGHGQATRTLARRWQAAFEDRVDPLELRLRTAGVLLSLATGPHRVQEPGWPDATCARLDLVQGWLTSAATTGPS